MYYLTFFGFISLLVGVFLGVRQGQERELLIASVSELRTENIKDYIKREWEYKWQKTRHSHAMLFSLLCMIVDLILNSFTYSDFDMSVRHVGSIALMFGVAIWILGSAGHRVALMAPADLLILVGVLSAAYLVFININVF